MAEPAEEYQRTPFFEMHKSAGARMVSFAGWEMPVSYVGILEEHSLVRHSVGIFDVSHMGEFLVSGSQAEDFLDYLVTNRIEGCPTGKAVYSPMCDEKGGVVDDLIAYRRANGDFLVVVNAANCAKDFAWMSQRVGLFEVSLTDESDHWALLAVQGPEAKQYLLDCGFEAVRDLNRFRIMEIEWKGVEILISRTGYTGEDGYEIFIPAGSAVKFAGEIGAGDRLPWIGLGARDSLRLEAGLPLYGHEMTESISPVQAGFGWAVKTDKANFIGKDALSMEKMTGPEKIVRYFTAQGKRIAREGMLIFGPEGEVGTVLSGSKSPVLDQPIGSALVDSSFNGQEAEVDSRGRRFPIRFRKPPLHRPS